MPSSALGGQSRKVAELADTMDAVCVTSGRFLVRNPAARLIFMAYLLVLHLWVLFLIVVHTHALPHEAHAMPGAPPAALAPRSFSPQSRT